MTREEAINQIHSAFDRLLALPPGRATDLVPSSLKDGKLYEAHVLSVVLLMLVEQEGFSATLSSGREIRLKSSGGPINPNYPHVQLSKGGRHLANLWTDVEFTALSCIGERREPTAAGDFHELDILVADTDSAPRPHPDQIWLGVECKHTTFEKHILRGILGVRRELGYLSINQEATRFTVWPRQSVPMDPPSCLMLYCTDPAMLNYTGPGETFGIDFQVESMG